MVTFYDDRISIYSRRKIKFLSILSGLSSLRSLCRVWCISGRTQSNLLLQGRIISLQCFSIEDNLLNFLIKCWRKYFFTISSLSVRSCIKRLGTLICYDTYNTVPYSTVQFSTSQHLSRLAIFQWYDVKVHPNTKNLLWSIPNFKQNITFKLS